jgi:hypothetical protein
VAEDPVTLSLEGVAVHAVRILRDDSQKRVVYAAGVTH